MATPTQTPPDPHLLALARSGDSAAYNALISRYFGMVYAIAFSRLGHHESAEDLAQEVFLRVHVRLGDLREGGRFAAWVTSIARNLAADWRRDGRRRYTVLLIRRTQRRVARLLQKKVSDPRRRHDPQPSLSVTQHSH